MKRETGVDFHATSISIRCILNRRDYNRKKMLELVRNYVTWKAAIAS